MVKFQFLFTLKYGKRLQQNKNVHVITATCCYGSWNWRSCASFSHDLYPDPLICAPCACALYVCVFLHLYWTYGSLYCNKKKKMVVIVLVHIFGIFLSNSPSSNAITTICVHTNILGSSSDALNS